MRLQIRNKFLAALIAGLFLIQSIPSGLADPQDPVYLATLQPAPGVSVSDSSSQPPAVAVTDPYNTAMMASTLSAPTPSPSPDALTQPALVATELNTTANANAATKPPAIAETINIISSTEIEISVQIANIEAPHTTLGVNLSNPTEPGVKTYYLEAGNNTFSARITGLKAGVTYQYTFGSTYGDSGSFTMPAYSTGYIDAGSKAQGNSINFFASGISTANASVIYWEKGNMATAKTLMMDTKDKAGRASATASNLKYGTSYEYQVYGVLNGVATISAIETVATQFDREFVIAVLPQIYNVRPNTNYSTSDGSVTIVFGTSEPYYGTIRVFLGGLGYKTLNGGGRKDHSVTFTFSERYDKGGRYYYQIDFNYGQDGLSPEYEFYRPPSLAPYEPMVITNRAYLEDERDPGAEYVQVEVSEVAFPSNGGKAVLRYRDVSRPITDSRDGNEVGYGTTETLAEGSIDIFKCNPGAPCKANLVATGFPDIHHDDIIDLYKPITNGFYFAPGGTYEVWIEVQYNGLVYSMTERKTISFWPTDPDKIQSTLDLTDGNTTVLAKIHPYWNESVELAYWPVNDPDSVSTVAAGDYTAPATASTETSSSLVAGGGGDTIDTTSSTLIGPSNYNKQFPVTLIPGVQYAYEFRVKRQWLNYFAKDHVWYSETKHIEDKSNLRYMRIVPAPDISPEPNPSPVPNPSPSTVPGGTGETGGGTPNPYNDPIRVRNPSVTTTTVNISGEVRRPASELANLSIRLYMREQGTSQWITVMTLPLPNNMGNGDSYFERSSGEFEFYVQGLEPGKTYEYKIMDSMTYQNANVTIRQFTTTGGVTPNPGPNPSPTPSPETDGEKDGTDDREDPAPGTDPSPTPSSVPHSDKISLRSVTTTYANGIETITVTIVRAYDEPGSLIDFWYLRGSGNQPEQKVKWDSYKTTDDGFSYITVYTGKISVTEGLPYEYWINAVYENGSILRLKNGTFFASALGTSDPRYLGPPVPAPSPSLDPRYIGPPVPAPTPTPYPYPMGAPAPPLSYSPNPAPSYSPKPMPVIYPKPVDYYTPLNLPVLRWMQDYRPLIPMMSPSIAPKPVYEPKPFLGAGTTYTSGTNTVMIAPLPSPSPTPMPVLAWDIYNEQDS